MTDARFEEFGALLEESVGRGSKADTLTIMRQFWAEVDAEDEDEDEADERGGSDENDYEV